MSAESLAGLAELRFEAMGVECHLLGFDGGPPRLEEAAAWVRSMASRLTRFDPASELSAFNASSGREVPVSEELESVLQAALAAWHISGGLVNVAVLGSMLAIGYGRTFGEGPTSPRPELVRPAPALPEVLEVGGGRARLAPGCGVDLGGIAKGWLADRLAERLGGTCVANLGGDLFARGSGPQGGGWPVGLGGQTVLLSDRGAATSGTWRRRWEAGGRRYHHLIDPRTGGPAESGVDEASVIAETALAAEVHAKAAVILGPEAAPAYLAGCCEAWWLR